MAPTNEMPSLTKTDRVVLYIIARLKGELGRTKLIKMAYLSDYLGRLLLSRPITSFKYKLFERGPFDPAFYKAVEALQSGGYIAEQFMPEWDGYRYDVKKEPLPMNLPSEEMFILDRVIDEYGRLPLEALLDEVVYKTEPARRAKEAAVVRAPLDLESVNGRLRDRFGFDLAAYLRSEAARKKGDMVSMEDLIGKL